MLLMGDVNTHNLVVFFFLVSVEIGQLPRTVGSTRKLNCFRLT